MEHHPPFISNRRLGKGEHEMEQNFSENELKKSCLLLIIDIIPNSHIR